MPCRDKSATLAINPRKIIRIKPFHLCRVPAQVFRPIMKYLIFITKFGENRIFNPGTRQVQPWHRLDRVAQITRFCKRPVRLSSQWPGTRPAFSCLTGTRPALFGDFGRFFGSFGDLK
jgi:hypothetical protein